MSFKTVEKSSDCANFSEDACWQDTAKHPRGQNSFSRVRAAFLQRKRIPAHRAAIRPGSAMSRERAEFIERTQPVLGPRDRARPDYATLVEAAGLLPQSLRS